MTDADIGESADQVAVPRKWGRVVLIVAGALVVVLGVTAGIVIPRVQQAQRVEEYTALVGELQGILDKRAQVETTMHAASALGDARHAEVLMAANAVERLGESPEPMLPAAHAEALAMVGVSAAEELGPLDDSEEAVSLQSKLITAYVDAKQIEVNASNAAIEVGEDPLEGELPDLFAEVTVEQAAELLGAPVEPEPVNTVADEDITDKEIEELRAAIAAEKAELARVEAALADHLVRHQAVADAAQIMLPVLQEAAAAVDDFLAAVEDEAAKAEDEVAQKTATAAQRVRESADSTNLSELHGSISSYVAAGEESLASHAAVVKAEEEAAEAKRKAEEDAAKKRASQKNSSSSEGWGSKGMCNYWAPMGGGMYMAPCT